jgi:hypothetical protein
MHEIDRKLIAGFFSHCAEPQKNIRWVDRSAVFCISEGIHFPTPLSADFFPTTIGVLWAIPVTRIAPTNVGFSLYNVFLIDYILVQRSIS